MKKSKKLANISKDASRRKRNRKHKTRNIERTFYSRGNWQSSKIYEKKTKVQDVILLKQRTSNMLHHMLPTYCKYFKNSSRNRKISTGIKDWTFNTFTENKQAKRTTTKFKTSSTSLYIKKNLAICIINRIGEKVCDKIIPISQCAYLPGRSSTELVFTFKTLAGKAITSCGYETNLLLLDMSKAFDTIERSTLIEDLKETLENDELHLIKMLLKDVEYRVRLKGKIGESFLTNIGSPQGDGASALLFIIYLAISLKKYKETRDDSQLPSFLKDHTYQKTDNDNNNFLTIDQQYADDIGWASTGQHIIENVEREVPHALKKRDLKINPEKTEKYRITRNGDTEWKKIQICWKFLRNK